MSAQGGRFELRGHEGDETRLLVHSDTGYAIAIPGRPHLIAPSSESPTYDVLIAMSDAPIELGFRMDTNETAIPPENLVPASALAYAQARAADPSRLTPQKLQGRMRAPGSKTSLALNYGLRGDDDRAMEYLVVTGRANEGTVSTLQMTVRYRRGETSPFAWANLRTALLSSQSWKPGELPATTIFPDATWFTPPSVTFELTDEAFAAAREKADAIDAIDQADVDALADVLIEIVNDDSEPRYPWHPMSTDHLVGRLASVVPTRIVEVLGRDLDKVQSVHDLRGWAWQCYWALGNRAALRSRSD